MSKHGILKSSFVLQCNGAPAPARPKGRGRRTPEPQQLATYGRSKNVVLKITDIADRMVQNITSQVIDLLEIAALVYAADQCSNRTPGQKFDYGRRWHRILSFEIAVREPDFWNQANVRETLVQTLSFLSEDDYEFNFHLAHDPPKLPEYLEFGFNSPGERPIEQVMLMSGGLDSLAGAAEQVLMHKRHVAMVSHRSVAHLGTRQQRLVDEVGKRGKDRTLRPFHVPVTAHKLGIVGEDFTQRSRSFLYAGMGAAVADMFGLSEVWFYENGITSVNLPLCAQEVGGHATRTTHPQSLHGFGRILSLVFNRPFAVQNGLFWHTKQDVLKILHRYRQSDLARIAVSCSHTRQVTNPSPHCGMCSQCLGRRVAAIGAEYGEDDPGRGYRSDPLTAARHEHEERILAERFVGQARLVARMPAADEFTRKYAGELSRVYPYLNMPPSQAAERLFDLHLRHARQTSEVVVGQLAQYAGTFWAGDVEATSTLAYAYGIGKPTRQARHAAATAATAVPPPPSHDPGSGSPVELDPATFAVTTRQGRYEFRGRSKRAYALLARIARRPGHHVSFQQLQQPGDVWNNSRVADGTIRSAYARLARALRRANLTELADAIKTGTFEGRPYVVLELPLAD